MKNQEPYIYPPGIGQDPAVWEMNAAAYGWQIQWPEKKIKPLEYDWLTLFLMATGLLYWMLPAWLFHFPGRRGWSAGDDARCNLALSSRANRRACAQCIGLAY